jgi:hypothetical protein
MTVGGVSDERVMQLLKMPLSEQEEAILALLTKVNRLEHDYQNLLEENKRLKWSLTEHD